jgi:cell division protein FtsI (penicillin-binding protein 3)
VSLIDRRIGVLFLAFIVMLAIAVMRATYLGGVKAGSLKRAAATQQVVQVAVPASRGTITTENGTVLAISESADDLTIDPYLIKHPQEVAQQLAPLLGQPVGTVLAAVTKPHTGFVYLAHQLPAARALAIDKLNIDGINLIPEMLRTYPHGTTASQVIGNIHQSGVGYSGIEQEFDSQLSGSSGARRLVNDAIGQTISVDDVRPARPGKTVQLTIDSNLQEEMEKVLAGVGATYSPKGATAIAMDPRTSSTTSLARPSRRSRSPEPSRTV